MSIVEVRELVKRYPSFELSGASFDVRENRITGFIRKKRRGAFFSALGLYKSFEFSREANDAVFSTLLPVAKKDLVKGKYGFVCLIELCALILMTVLSYRKACTNFAKIDI